MTATSPTPPPNLPWTRGLILLGRGLLAFWVFAAFPVLVLQIALAQIEAMEVEARLDRHEATQEKRLGKLLAIGDDVGLLCQMLRGSLSRMGIPGPGGGRARLRRLERLFPGAFDVYWFDGDGRVIPGLSAGRHPRRATEMVFRALRKVEKTPLTHNEEGLVMSFLRITSADGLAASRDRPFRLLRRETDGFLFWNVQEHGPATAPPVATGTPRGFIALLHPAGFRRNPALQAGLRLFGRRYPADRYGRVALGGGRIRLFPTSLGLRSDLRRGLLAALGRYDRQFETEGSVVTLLRRSPTEYLLALSPRPRFFRPVTWTAFHLACAAWILVVAGRLLGGGGLLWGPIPRKLMGLFFFAVGTPALVLLVIGFYALRDHGNVLRQNLETRIRQKLALYDRHLSSELARLEARLNQIVGRARLARSPGARNQALEEIRTESPLDQAFLVDQTGSAAFMLNDTMGIELTRKRNNLSLILCREVLRRLNKSIVFDAGSIVAQATESMFDSLVGGGGTDFDKLSREMGKFTEMTFFDESAFLYLDAFFNREGQAESLLLVHMSRDRLERSFLAKTLRGLVRQPDFSWRVNALGVISRFEDVLTTRDDLGQYDRIAQAVMATRGAVREVTASGTEESLWVGLAGQNITRYVLVARAPLGPVGERLQVLWGWLVAVALLIFLATGVIAVLLLENILAPVESLQTGINAIQGRQFDHRIPIHADDELGHVSSLMNTMIEGMHDLQVAKIVQESLFPAGDLAVGGYGIRGRSRAMADIGGDYYDYFQGPDGRLIGLIGDVSGHGVSAALIMGMAKCALTMDETPGRSVTEMMMAFNRFLLKTIKRKKMMTMFCFALDPAGHELTFANAGHNYPFLQRAGVAGVEELKQDSMPLGVRAGVKYTTSVLPLRPGDAILLYTDGLVEAPLHNGEQVGYDLAKDWFARAAHLPPDQVVDRLFQKFDEETASDQPSDDVSLICLKRLA
ncbi:MAG: SpoIIE family protein phosphatase [Candidatus Riflebacteria bacterium]|nr:SpoIIE family protein phosphatase [Candidatus Riflebacteria bacterium]